MDSIKEDDSNYSKKVFDYFFGKIEDGTLKSGDKLPAERELTLKLGISRIPLREALKALSTIGLLKTIHGKGTFVNEFDEDYLSSILFFITVLDAKYVLELMQMRKIIESESARLAARYGTESQIKELEKINIARLDLYNLNKDDLTKCRNKLRNLDRKFHALLVDMSGNKVFKSFYFAFLNVVEKHQIMAVASNPIKKKSFYFHPEIIKAIKNKDEELAYEYMYKHLEEVELSIKKNIELFRS
jgi:GntR family transcriptional repressor for pyruvate dehydrogenase complex